jgi:hypothetical protein
LGRGPRMVGARVVGRHSVETVAFVGLFCMCWS